jgi:hypothetical protein
VHSFINQYTIAQTNTRKAQGERPTDKFLDQIQHESRPNGAGTSNRHTRHSAASLIYIHQTPQQASYAQQEPYQTTFMPQIPILPQQPNYAIHISQAATSRAPTQTADFAEAEESTDSGDNDDRLSWQAVGAEEVRKEEAPEPQKC